MSEQAHAAKHGSEGRPRVVIIGGGFGGIEAARTLGGSSARVTLIDRRNHHVFQPLLYQVATAALNPANIASPIRRILRGLDNVEVLLGDVEAIDVPAKVVRMTDGEAAYDYLIVATGATHSYFGHEEWADDAPGLKSIEDCARHPPKGPPGLRGGRTRTQPEASAGVDDLRRRRWRADRRGVGRGPG